MERRQRSKERVRMKLRSSLQPNGFDGKRARDTTQENKE